MTFARLKYLCIAGCLFTVTHVSAQPSYIYIQGDKQTPFYVKLDGKMQPRYGKNYAIIPNLPAGPAHIEILFQQHAYPEQEFTVDVPEHGCRGLLLDRQGDKFVLYDLRQKKYISAEGEQNKDKNK